MLAYGRQETPKSHSSCPQGENTDQELPSYPAKVTGPGVVSLPFLWIHLHLKDYLLTATIATHSSYGNMEIVQYFQERKYRSTIWKVVRP